MRKVILCMLLLAIPFVGAEEFIFDDELYEVKDLDVQIVFTNDIHTSGNVRRLEATLFYYPQDDPSQKVLESNILPRPSDTTDDSFVFSWNRPSRTETIAYDVSITSSFDRPRIKKEIGFPLDGVPGEFAAYLQSEEIIQITPEIRALANTIIGEEKDAARVIFKLGKWVKDNIEYDLNTVTVEASQTSAWVLETRTGVCDELTSLFIAMVRSVGIPAKFVSGIAYTNLESLDTNWGPHGWAEIWLPSVGWIPYDVTYGQFGFVDATHIKLRESVDASGSAVQYYMESINGNLDPGPLDRTTTLLRKGSLLPQDVELAVELAAEHVGPDSYNRVDATITNTRSYYIGAELFLAKTEGVSTEDTSVSILLGPGETQKIHWVVHIDQEIEPRFRYTFPIVVYTNTNLKEETAIIAETDELVLTQADVEVNERAEDNQLAQPLTCVVPENLRAETTTQITCTHPQEARICIAGDCIVGVEHTAEVFLEAVGAQVVKATADRSGKSTQQLITLAVLDTPSAYATIVGPSTAGFNEYVQINVTVDKMSFSNPEDITLTLENPLFSQTWDISEDRAHTVGVRVAGNQLAAGENELKFILRYTADGKQEEKVYTATITPEADAFGDNVVLWTNWIFATLGGLLA